MDNLALINGIIKVVRPVGYEDVKVNRLDEPANATGLDSLDLLMVAIYLSDIYGVDEEKMKAMQVTTLQQMLDYVIWNKTKEPESLEAALASIQ